MRPAAYFDFNRQIAMKNVIPEIAVKGYYRRGYRCAAVRQRADLRASHPDRRRLYRPITPLWPQESLLAARLITGWLFVSA